MGTSHNKNYALPITMMFALFFMISFVTGLQNPFGVIVKEQFQASNFMSQLGNAANFIAYAVMGIPAGLLLKRIGYKGTALIAIITGFVGVFIMYLSGIAASFYIYLMGAFVSGFSMCMLNTVVNPMLNTLGSGGNKGNQLIQFGGTISSIGATIVPVLVGYLIGNTANATIKDANPALFIAMSIFAFAFIILIFVGIPEPHQKALALRANDKHSALSFRHFRLGAVAIFIYVGIEVAIPNFINVYLTTPLLDGGMGIDRTSAGVISGTYWFLMLVGRFIGASVANKVSSRSMLLAVSCLGAIFTLGAYFSTNANVVSMPVINSDLSFSMIQTPLSVMLMTLVGLSTSIMWGGIFNLAVEGLGRYTNMASGIFMVMVCGGGIIPAIRGYIADIYGFKSSYLVVIFGLLYLIYYAIWGSRNVNKRIRTY